MLCITHVLGYLTNTTVGAHDASNTKSGRI